MTCASLNLHAMKTKDNIMGKIQEHIKLLQSQMQYLIEEGYCEETIQEYKDEISSYEKELEDKS